MSIFGPQTTNMLTTAVLLMLFAILGAILVGTTFTQTEDVIKHNEEITLLNKLNSIIPKQQYDNDLLLDKVMLSPSSLLGTSEPTLAYRARKGDEDVAAVFSCIAPNGYSGSIFMLVGIYADGSVAGVRVVKHRETPGLGDKINLAVSDWILGFNGKSLSQPKSNGWKVKRDGGEFDQFTGATITPRAVVKAVHDALLYFKQNRDTIFSVHPEKDKPS